MSDERIERSPHRYGDRKVQDDGSRIQTRALKAA
jgi:hypothetical protein